ncbi:50S ribosomal protein L4 [Candidatus Woesearchaeota archaeon]|nr:50S ribosomal protein L4 [Candidatus Woesearchaeota archaeon]
MKADVYTLEGTKAGSVELPEQFNEEYEPDLVKRAILAVESHNRTPYGAMAKAGMGVSAKLSRRRRDYKGSYGKGISRAPRKTMWRRGMQFGWVGALAPGTRGGRQSHPAKPFKIYAQKINIKERKKAIRSALNGSVAKGLMMVVEDKFETVKKSKDLVKVFDKMGIDHEKVERKKAGRGKSRGRSKRFKKNALIILSKKCDVMNALKNLPGVDAVEVNRLNAKLLTLGHDTPRKCVWTKSAVERLTKENLFRGKQ